MPVQATDQSLSQAIFRSVTSNTYPDEEQIVSADLSFAAADSLSELLLEARNEVQTSIRELSSLSATNIDSWVTQTRQLRDDIENSEKRASEIVALSNSGKELYEKVHDAGDQVTLLRKEIAFNESLYNTLKQIQEVKKIVDITQEAVITRSWESGLKLLQRSKDEHSALNGCHNTRLADLIQAKMKDVENTLVESASGYWKDLIVTDFNESSITINDSIDGVSLTTVANVLEELGQLIPNVAGLKEDLETIILFPRLRIFPNNQTLSLLVGKDRIQLLGQKSMLSVDSLCNDLDSAISLLSSVLPGNVVQPLSEIMMPGLISGLISGPLSSSVPLDRSGLVSFESSVSRVKDLSKSMETKGWTGSGELSSWASEASNVWLTRRSDSSLHSIRQILLRGLGMPRSVERVETQTVTRQDKILQGNEDADKWDASWSDNDQEGNFLENISGKSSIKTSKKIPENNDEDDDDGGDAWGWDEDIDGDNIDENSTKATDPEGGEEDSRDTWGWEIEDDVGSPLEPEKHLVSSQRPQNQKGRQEAPKNDQIVTLRELYFVTSLPEQILEIIVQVVDDADYLAKSDQSSNPIIPAAAHLFRLPILLLSMYRASAPTFYNHDINGNMYTYNDCLYLAEQLKVFIEHHDSTLIGDNRLESTGLENEISTLEIFGKIAYRREMESQRTILGDLLDNAQEFRNCTEQPFSEQCEIAISSVMDRLRGLHGQFKDVLSTSTLNQAIGSLLGTVTSKIVVNIEDMSDISAPESQKLASFCRRVVELQELFIPSDTKIEGEQIAIAAAIYTPKWWKFQYLAEILDSSLADIKFLWTEGELSLEFGHSEIIDLIEALFADSEHRKSAVAEIKRSEGRA